MPLVSNLKWQTNILTHFLKEENSCTTVMYKQLNMCFISFTRRHCTLFLCAI